MRLPSEFRFDGDEVFIRRDPVTGDVILSSTRDNDAWETFFAIRDAAAVEPGFLDHRPGNEPLELRDAFPDAG